MSWKKLKQRSYVPYSHKQSACAVLGTGGSWYAGVRIENISYPLTISPWQAALFSCISNNDWPRKLLMPSDAERDRMLDFWEAEYELQISTSSEPPSNQWHEPLEGQPENPSTRLQELLSHAAIENSNFPVSALLETSEGYIAGANIECSDWSLGLCAERVALAIAISAGYSKFNSLSIHTKYGEFSSPCGACRQVIIEHMPYQPVDLYHSNGSHSRHFSAHLMPFTFKSSRLDRKDGRPRTAGRGASEKE